MKIQPPGSGKPSGIGPRESGRVDSARTRETEQDKSSASGGSSDQVLISQEARILQLPDTEIPSGTLEPARAREIIDRIASGYYDQSDVQQEVVSRLGQYLGQQ